MNAPAYGYARVSTDEQYHSRLSIDEQQAQITSFCEQHELDLGPARCRLREEAASAYKLRFEKRPVGGELNALLRAGDHLVIAKVDRAFRNMTDAFNRVQDWHQRGILVHILDTPGGGYGADPLFDKLILAVLAWSAEFESQRRSERMVDAWRSARKTGKHMGLSHAPWGFRWRGNKRLGTARLDYCPEERAVMAVCFELHQQQRLSIAAICSQLIRRRLKPMDRRPEWTRNTKYRLADVYHGRYVREMIVGEAQLRYYEAAGLCPEEAAAQWLIDFRRDRLPGNDEIMSRLTPGAPV